MKYHLMLRQRSKLTKSEFEALMNSIYTKINIIEDDNIVKCIEQAMDPIGNRDEKDVPYLAAAICSNLDGIWSNDPDFDSQTLAKRYGTSELIKRYNI